jgi:hypothetical protein
VTAEQRIDVLERQMLSLRREVRELTEYVDTVSSPLWKRCLWWAQGFYFRKVGRWYEPRWLHWPK